MVLSYQRDAYLRTLMTTLLECSERGGSHAVRLADTIFYPTGGGQPHDRGWIAGVEVLDVQRDAKGVVHEVAGPIDLGEVDLELDWARRYDHMQQHTGQHLISAIAQDRFGWATTSFHLGAQECSVDLDVGEIPESELAALERAVNDEIRAARPVSARLVDPEELEGLGVRTRGLPEGHVGTVRLVEIGGVDLNTCGGTHLYSTAELQAVKLLGVGKMHAQARVAFVCGQRVVDRLDRSMAREAGLTALLCRGPEEHLDSVQTLLAEQKRSAKRMSVMQRELAERVACEALDQNDALLSVHRPGADMGTLSAMAAIVGHADPERVALFSAGDSDRGSGLFVLTGPAPLVEEAGPRIAACMGGRGGGRGPRYQGKVERLEGLEDALSVLRELLAARSTST
jgi:Ser-tRNA(Ala) deacylase AlaX